MSSPSGAPPLTSPDGRWRWDGMSWVPIPAQPGAPRPMAPRWVAVIVVGSIASLLLVGTGLAAISSLYTSAAGGGLGPGAQSRCLPSDFPIYPGAATVTSLRAFSICTTGFTTPDTRYDVLSYYEVQLVSYPWRLTGESRSQGLITFSRQDGGRGSGEVSVSPSGNPTQLEVVYRT